MSSGCISGKIDNLKNSILKLIVVAPFVLPAAIEAGMGALTVQVIVVGSTLNLFDGLPSALHCTCSTCNA